MKGQREWQTKETVCAKALRWDLWSIWRTRTRPACLKPSVIKYDGIPRPGTAGSHHEFSWKGKKAFRMWIRTSGKHLQTTSLAALWGARKRSLRPVGAL